MAKAVDFKTIYDIFKKYKEIFPHIRADYLKRMIDKDNVICDNGVVIIFQKYLRGTRLGNYTAKKGTYILHQIVNENAGNGETDRVFQDFLNRVIDDKDGAVGIVLTVRASNKRACKFYEQMSFEKVGKIDWKGGEIPGVVYFLDVSNTPGDKGAW